LILLLASSFAGYFLWAFLEKDKCAASLYSDYTPLSYEYAEGLLMDAWVRYMNYKK
jgi:hypothetical protein